MRVFINTLSYIFILILSSTLETTLSLPFQEAESGFWRQDISFTDPQTYMEGFVPFRAKFTSSPKVAVSINRLSVGQDIPGIDLTVTYVNTTGFKFKLSQGLSPIFKGDFTWIAFNHPSATVLSYSKGEFTMQANSLTNLFINDGGVINELIDIAYLGYSQPKASVVINGFGFTTAIGTTYDTNMHRGFEINATAVNPTSLLCSSHAYEVNTITYMKADIIIYDDNGLFAGEILDPGPLALDYAASDRIAILLDVQNSSKTPIVFFGLNSFYYLNTINFRFKTLNEMMTNPYDDVWILNLTANVWDVNILRNVKLATFWLLNTNAYEINCPGSLKVNTSIPNRCGTDCNQFFAPLQCNNATCLSPNYVYWNNSCLSTCPHPLKIDKEVSLYVEYCKNPCGNKFLYWNGSCSEICEFPLRKRYEPGVKYCEFPCLSSEYLYWNGTCSSSCSMPLGSLSIMGNKFCNYPCDKNSIEYLLWNGTCLTECSQNFVKVKFNGLWYCNLPAPDFSFVQTQSEPTIFTLTFNQKMNTSLENLQKSISLNFAYFSSSDFTFKILQSDEASYNIYLLVPRASISRQYLTIKISSNIINMINQSLIKTSDSILINPILSESALVTIKQVKEASQAALTSVGASSVPLVVLAGNPIFLWVLLNLIQNYYYLLFINIDYPENLSSLLSLFQVGTFSFMPNIFGSLNIGDLEEKKLGAPQKFEEQNFDSFFLLTGGGNLTVIVGFLFASLISLLISKYIRNMPFGILYFARKTVMRFVPNMLNVWQGLFLNLNIAAFLQLYNLDSSDNIHIISSLISYVVIISSILVIIYYYRDGKKKISKSKSLEIYFIKSEFKNNNAMCYMFPCFELLQKFIFGFILVFLYSYQSTLIALLMISRFFFLGYMIYYKPFTDPVSNISNAFSEFLYIVAILLAGILHKLNSLEDIEEDRRLLIGYMMIGLCMTTLGFYIFMMLVGAILGLKELDKKFNIFKKIFTKKPVEAHGYKTTRKFKRARDLYKI